MAGGLTLERMIDRAVELFAPERALRRSQARIAGSMLLSGRTYEAAAHGRRTEHWHRAGTDGNAVIGPALALVRAKARHMVRNNGIAAGALDTLSTYIAGPYGIASTINSRRARDTWREWADSTDCDADGVNDFAGLQHLAVRTMIESGEVVIRRRRRRVEDGLRIPLQIQIVEPDHLDTLKSGNLPNGGRIVHGVEFDAIGRRVAYWMFRDHPGAAERTSAIVGGSVRVPASEVSHVFASTRAGQARAISWFAPVLLKLSDFDEFDDARLVKEKIAACLAVFTRSIDDSDAPLGKEHATDPLVETLEPGMVTRLGAGEEIQVVNPPQGGDYDPFAKSQLRTIAAGLGLTYEDLTGDYTGLPYSAARMSRKRLELKVEGWRWRTVIPRVCAPVWRWFAEAALTAGVLELVDVDEPPTWTPTPLPMIDPDKEVSGLRRGIRAGLITPQDAIRERGYQPDQVLAELAAWNKAIDELGIVLDSDPRAMSDGGQRHSAADGEIV